ncbi:hypothetical protein Mgra_00008609, partial [Meloidogyne graminicola]
MDFGAKDHLKMNIISSKLPNLIDLQCDKNPLKMPQDKWLLSEEEQALCILSRLFIFASTLVDKLYNKFEKTRSDDNKYIRIIAYGEWLKNSAANILMYLGPGNEIAIQGTIGGLFSKTSALQKIELLAIEFMEFFMIDLCEDF